jgi:hypothetical protein
MGRTGIVPYIDLAKGGKGHKFGKWEWWYKRDPLIDEFGNPVQIVGFTGAASDDHSKAVLT